jgi:hypothetical protein
MSRVATFLCSDAAKMVVWQTSVIDGGFSLPRDFFPRRPDTKDRARPVTNDT